MALIFQQGKKVWKGRAVEQYLKREMPIYALTG